MATNNFKPFATAANANVTAQADWESLPALLSGFTAGKASSAQVNKAIRQATTIAALVGQFIANSGADALDNADVNGLVTKFTNALTTNLGLGEAAKLPSPSFITGPGYTLFKSPFMDGAVVRWFSTLSMSVTPPALTNNTSFSVTFPSAFSSNVMAVLSSDCGQIVNGGAQDLGTQIDKISLTGLVIFSRWETRPPTIGDFKFIVTGVMNV
ncbi:TPA: hypothetical protein ACJIWZ_004159 [Enterobacter kobei]